jgi:uridine phosphorylase
MLDRIKNELLNLGLKFISVDDKIVRMFLETAPSNVNEIVILPAVKMVMKKLMQKLQNKVNYGRVFNGTLNGVKVSIIRSQVGCPNAALAVECLKRTKAKIIIRIDFCGGIPGVSPSIEIGDIIIPKEAYCDDGTSPQYIRTNPLLLNELESVQNPISQTQNLRTGNTIVFKSKPFAPLEELLLKESLEFKPNKTKEVSIWTTDALFCEDYDFIKALQLLNVQAIDMESSILFLLGNLYNIKTASILSVSDLPTHPHYDLLNSNEIHPEMEKGIDNAINTLLKSLPKILHSLVKL